MIDAFRAVSRHLPSALLLVAPDGSIVAANPAATRLLARSAGPVEGLALDALLFGPDLAGYLATCARTTTPVAGAFILRTSGEVRLRCEGARLHRDEPVVQLRLWEREASDPFLLLRQKMEELQDENERRKRAEDELRRSEARLRRIYDAGLLGIVLSRADGAVEEANDAWLHMIGYDRVDLEEGRLRWRDLTLPQYRSFDDRALEQLRTQGVVTPYEKEYRRKDGSFLPVLVGAALLEDGNDERWVSFVLDLSRRKRVEREREALLEELQRAMHMSELFVGILGHDLRNPLSAIRMAAEVIRRRGTDEKSARSATRILASADRMTRMIEQLLDVTRVRLGAGIPLERQPGDLRLIAARVLEELELAHPERSLLFETNGDTCGDWDADRLEQVCSNLVANALQHGEGGPVAVHLDGGAAEAVVLSVQNRGFVPSALLPTLFEPFERLESRGHGKGGLGLGLYITRQIVLAHGGDIEVSSSPEAGTTMRVTLPRRASARLPGAVDRLDAFR